jgi:transcriptional regulator with XRE-family HTH domain
LAEQVGVRQSTVTRWELGLAIPGDERKVAIATALGLPAEVVFPLGDS